MKVLETQLPGVVIIEPKIFEDSRGFFMEIWSQRRYAEVGLPERFVQDNVSFSRKGVLRGLHFQNPNAQAKLVYVLRGEVFDVAVDIRIGSPTFGEWVGVSLSETNRRQLYIPEGFAHGYCVTSQSALFAYKCTGFYEPTAEGGISWEDQALGIDWPCSKPILSEKDRRLPRLAEVPLNRLPAYREP